MQALRNPALEKVEKKLTGKTEEPSSEKRSSVKDKLQTTSSAQKSFVLTFLKNWTTKCRALEKVSQENQSVSPEKSHKQGDRPDRDVDVTENVLSDGQNEDVELCAEVVPPHVLEELDDKIRALEKVTQESRPAKPRTRRSRKCPLGR